MKMNKKKVFTLALAVCLIAILSLSSLAWFSDSDEVVNNFHVGGEGGDADTIFHLDVYESIDDNGDGVIDRTIGWDGDSSEDGDNVWNYENVVPGNKLWKKVYAHNRGLYDQWVRFKVTVDNASVWADLEEEYGFKLQDLLLMKDGTKLVDSTDWTFAAEETVVDEDANTVTYVFYYNAVLTADNSWVYLFNYVQIPEAFDQYDMALFADGLFTMTVKGEAVQVENVVVDSANDVPDAMEAFAYVENN